MAFSEPLTAKEIAKICALLEKGLSQEVISKQVGRSASVVGNVKRTYFTNGTPGHNSLLVRPLSLVVFKDLFKRNRGAVTVEEVARYTNQTQASVKAFISEMKDKGVLFHYSQGAWSILDSSHIKPLSSIWKVSNEVKIGALGDNHLCNRHSRLDVLQHAYKHFKALGITKVYNTGNWIDGEMKFNKTELLTAPGLDNQIEYCLNEYPAEDGIVTEYIAGDDHEGWYQQREGIEVGKYLQLKAEAAGRFDLKYLGYAEHDVKLVHGKGSACMRIVHPGGGSSYAISYTDQKRVESYQGGEKPQIELVGHYHKFNHGYPREVHTVQTGCTCDQTLFMRKKRLQAHVGYNVITIGQGEEGQIIKFAVEWFPFFDRKYYEKRF